jgi:hypothetical protein
MKLDNNINIKPENIKHIATIGGIVSAIIITYYITGVYRNMLQIKRLKQDKDYSLTEEDK